jgi:putative peptidoglycan lipid II flippase
MVKGLLKFFGKETSSLHQAAYLLAFFAILSQILGLVRDRLLAHTFGAGETLDIYYAAFRIPDFILVTAGSVVSISILIPFIMEYAKGGKEKEREYISHIFSFFSILIVGAALLAFFLIPFIEELIFPTFSTVSSELLVTLTRILLLSPILLGFSNLLGSITQSHNKFLVYALSPLLYNFGIIVGIVFLNPIFGIKGVVYGVVIGALLHAGIQVPFIARIGLLPRISFRINWQAVKETVKISLPRALTLSTAHLSILVLISFASVLGQGSISVFNFSLNLQTVPITIVGVSYSIAAFPMLSKLFSAKNMAKFKEQVVTTSRHIIFWSLPLMALFVVLRAQIVRVVLGSGKFDWNDTRLTAAALALFTLSALFQSLTLLFIRAFYSSGNTRKPFILNVVSMLILVASTYFLVKFFYASPTFQYFISALFKVEDLPGNVVLMLPLGYTIGTIINSVMHWVVYEKEFEGYTSQVVRAFIHSLGAAVIMGLMTYLGLVVFGEIFSLSTLVGVFLQGLCAGLIGIVTWILILVLLNNHEIKEIGKTLHEKFWKAKVVGPDAEVTPL